MSIDEMLKGLDDRNKIIAVLSSPQLFFDRAQTEDQAIMMSQSYVSMKFKEIIEIKNVYLECLEACYRNIRYALFLNNSNARDVLYAGKDKAYLDTLIDWANGVIQKVKSDHDTFLCNYQKYLEEETGLPVFKHYDDYIRFNNERKSKA